MNSILHPALWTLYRQNVSAKFGKLFRALKSPRRLMLTAIATILASVWLSQVILSIFLRPPADRWMLRERIALGLFGFLVFQVLKVLFQKPVEPFEWTPSETQILKTAPLKRSHLVIYRLTTTAIAAMLKAACFVLVMIPDLNFILAGFVGMSLGLFYLELLRINAEAILFAISKQTKLIVKLAAAALVLLVAGFATSSVISQPGVNEKLSSPAAWQFLLAIVLQIAEYTRSSFGACIAYPFRCFSDTILSMSLDRQLLTNLLAGIGMVGSACYGALASNSWMVKALQKRDRKNLKRLQSAGTVTESAKRSTSRKVPVPSRLNGVGSIAWRQFCGAWNYRATILFSFAIPAILCWVPLFATTPAPSASLFLVASLLFYSYLLLPAALMLDFRRDVDRMAVLKKLPITSMAIVIGQLAAPVVLCSAFQAVVLAVAAASGVASYGFFAVCWLGIMPINVLIFASENIIFMLHPYRRNKEGADVLIRSMLTFTGKAVVWAIVLAALLLWTFASSHLSKSIGLERNAIGYACAVIFLTGTTTATSLLSWAGLRCLAKMFQRFDPGVDAVAMN